MTSTLTTNSGPMQLAAEHIRARLLDAIVEAFGAHCQFVSLVVEPAANPKFGDFQSNVAMMLSELLPPSPREIAGQILAVMTGDQIFESPTVAGPGFINFRLQPSFIAGQLAAVHADARLSVAQASPAQTIVIDMSSPNIAKEMHVGHLRSTIIGEAISRMLAHLGHTVLKINHVGDWGTQFGMLIAELKLKHPGALAHPQSLALGDVVQFYKQAKQHFDEDESFQDAARQEVVKLQSGDTGSLRAWELLCNQSRQAFERIYEQLDVKDLVEVGESFYNPQLAGLVEQLLDEGIAVESDGAICVFVEGFINHRDGLPLPLIIRKQDGGYNYATTDLAAMQHRVQHLGADVLIYVVDAGQATHLEMVTGAARLSGWMPDDVHVEHVPFGLVCGPDGKKLKTRSGDTVRLQDLLDEAVVRARKQLSERLAERCATETPSWIDATTKAIGIGAVKYNDLSRNRHHNYKYDADKMLSLEGNTAPFMLYSYARVNGISREGGVDLSSLSGQAGLTLSEQLELDLAKHLLKLSNALQAAVGELMPNRLCDYLFELSQQFNRFYHEHPVLNAPEPQRTTRLILCDLTARTLKLGLTLLGIPLVERM